MSALHPGLNSSCHCSWRDAHPLLRWFLHSVRALPGIKSPFMWHRGLCPRHPPRSLASALCRGSSSPCRLYQLRPFMGPFSPSSFHVLPEHLLCSRPATGTRIFRQAVPNLRTLTWGFIALGLRGHRRGPYRKSAGGPAVEQGAALIHQVALQLV